MPQPDHPWTRTTGFGASRPLPRVSAKVASPKRQRPLRLGGRNRSSCPAADLRPDGFERLSRVATCPSHPGLPPSAMRSQSGSSTTFPRFGARRPERANSGPYRLAVQLVRRPSLADVGWYRERKWRPGGRPEPCLRYAFSAAKNKPYTGTRCMAAAELDTGSDEGQLNRSRWWRPCLKGGVVGWSALLRVYPHCPGQRGHSIAVPSTDSMLDRRLGRPA